MKVAVRVLQYRNEVLISILITGDGIVIGKERPAMDNVNCSLPTEGCHLRILKIVPDGIRHPFLISFLLSKPWSSSKAKDDRQKYQTMQGSRDDESKPHAEVVYLWVA